MAGAGRRHLILASFLLLGLSGIAQAAGSVTAEHGVAAGGDIRDSSITIGLTPKQVHELVGQILTKARVDGDRVVELATRLGVTQGAVTTFLRTLGEKDVPVEQLSPKLGEIAERHKDLLAQIASVRAASPDVQAIKDEARGVVERGDYGRAESLLTKAEDAALAGADQLLLDAAALRAERGQLALARFDYDTALKHFAAAVDRLPRSKPLLRAKYLDQEGIAALSVGGYAVAKAALEEALALRTTGLPPEAPELAVSLNNLALLYWATGRYAEAEPLWRRLVAISRARSGDSGDTAIALNNLARLYEATGSYAQAEASYERAIVPAGHRDRRGGARP